MTINFWMNIILEIIKPTSLSWLVIVIPPLLLLITWGILKSKNPPREGAWKKLGERWRLLGMILLVSSVLSYLIVAYYSKKYDEVFSTRLSIKLKTPAENRDMKEDIRELCSYLDRDYLVDFIKDVTEKMPPDKRNDFIQAWSSTRFKKDVTIFYSKLYWPQEKIDEFKLDNKNASPIVVATGMAYTGNQINLMVKKDYVSLHKSLKPKQWKYLINQYLDPLDKAELTDLTENLTEYMDDPNTYVVDPLADKAFENNSSKKIAWYAGIPTGEKVIYFVKRYIKWLRDLPWTFIYIIISIILLMLGAKVYKEGRLNREGKLNIFSI